MEPIDDQPTSIFLFREDLRITDNPAFNAAINSGHPITCIFIYDEENDDKWTVGSARKWWLHYSLNSLMTEIKQLGGELILLKGWQQSHILEIVQKIGATQVYWTRRYGPNQIEVDKQVKSQLEAKGIKVTSMNGRLLFEPWHLKTGLGQPYRVFTPLWKTIKANGVVRQAIDRPASIHWAKNTLDSKTLSELNLVPNSPNWAEHFSKQWQPGEYGAQQRLARFIEDAAAYYSHDRNRPDKLGTSDYRRICNMEKLVRFKSGMLLSLQLKMAVFLKVKQMYSCQKSHGASSHTSCSLTTLTCSQKR